MTLKPGCLYFVFYVITSRIFAKSSATILKVLIIEQKVMWQDESMYFRSIKSQNRRIKTCCLYKFEPGI